MQKRLCAEADALGSLHEARLVGVKIVLRARKLHEPEAVVRLIHHGEVAVLDVLILVVEVIEDRRAAVDVVARAGVAHTV